MPFRSTDNLPCTKLAEDRTTDNLTVQSYLIGKLKVKVTSNEPSDEAVQAFNKQWNVLANKWAANQNSNDKEGAVA